MTRRIQGNRERAFVSRFRETMPELSGFLCTKQESPDFILEGDGQLIGVEVTELLLSPIRKGEEALENIVLSEAKRTYEISGGPALLVNVLFTSRLSMRKPDADQLGQQIGAIIVRHVDEGVKVGKIDHLELPPEVSSVVFATLRQGAQAVWGVVRAGAIPEIDVDAIQSTLQKKASRVADYRKSCDEVWLLIAVEGFQPSTWYDVEGPALEVEYKTDFDRVYLLDFQKPKSVKLMITQ